MDPQKKLSDKLYQRHALWAGDPAIKAMPVKRNMEEKFAEEFALIYNSGASGYFVTNLN
jgi:hypothetical protein